MIIQQQLTIPFLCLKHCIKYFIRELLIVEAKLLPLFGLDQIQKVAFVARNQSVIQDLFAKLNATIHKGYSESTQTIRFIESSHHKLSTFQLNNNIYTFIV